MDPSRIVPRMRKEQAQKKCEKVKFKGLVPYGHAVTQLNRKIALVALF